MCNDTTVSKLKNDFHYTLSKFSHELRNPLTLINSGLQMIASAHPDVKNMSTGMMLWIILIM